MELPSHLLPTKLERAFDGFALVHWLYRPERGATAEHIMDPDFWVHVTNVLKVNHVVSVVAMDGTLDADLRVVALDPRGMWAQMRLLRGWPTGAFADMDKPKTAMPMAQGPDADGYLVEFGGPHRWRIMRATGAKPELIAKDFPDQASALEALSNLKALRPRAGKAA